MLYRADSSANRFAVVLDGSAIQAPINHANPDTTAVADYFGRDYWLAPTRPVSTKQAATRH